MRLEPHLSIIFELLGWKLLGLDRHAFITGYLMEHVGITCREGSDDQVSKNSQSQISNYGLMKMHTFNY